MYHILFPPQSNRTSWEYYVKATDPDDNPIDLTGCSAVFAVNEKNRGHQRLVASTANGKITFPDIGIIRWFFAEGDMRGLCAGTYETGLVLTSDDGAQSFQFSVGPLPITDGVVP